MKRVIDLLIPGALVLALAAPAVAGAHVTLQPDSAGAGAFTVLNVRVPNESESAATTKVSVQMPPGFAEASYQPVPGWSVKVAKTKLDKPIKSDEGDTIAEQVSRITWTGDGNQGKIDPGEFMDFPLSVQVPGKAGDTLTFKALETYDDGEVVRWIGPPDADEPAPQVKVTAGEDQAAATPVASTDDNGEEEDDDGASKGLGIAALVVGGLGLLLGGMALARSRTR